MSHDIKIENCSIEGRVYYKAYVVGKEDYCSLGKTPEDAKAFLEKAIALRADIYGSV